MELVFLKAPSGSTPEDQLLVQFQGMIAECERAQIADWWWKTASRYLAARPSRRSLKRLRQSVHDLLRPSLCAPWEEVRDQLNVKSVGRTTSAMARWHGRIKE